eukprot:GGOE01001491.1.p1 GENE.GGOE01001491.1~~GGOE01001491.1.p1  ORF type:complete len:695 (-),score=131.72 GGOE01001491.1:58-2097(-)
MARLLLSLFPFICLFVLYFTIPKVQDEEVAVMRVTNVQFHEAPTLHKEIIEHIEGDDESEEAAEMGSACKADPLFEERYITACVVYGRHHNQLIMQAKLWSIALKYNRTLVLPNFFQAANKKSEDAQIRHQDLHQTPFEDVYSLPALQQGPVRVIPWAAFFSARDRHPVPAACFLMSNCVPRPTPKEFHCKRVVQNFDQSDQLLAVGARVLFVAEIQPSPCFWRFLQPSAPVAAEVAKVKAKLPERFLSAHLRTFATAQKDKWAECSERVRRKWISTHFKEHGVTQFDVLMYPENVCSLSPEYVRSQQKEAGLSEGLFFFGTDNYQPGLTQRLIDAGGRQYVPLVDLGTVGPVVVDFWVMVASALFLGNPLSSMSWNVCSVRWQRSTAGCPHLPRLASLPCLAFPDVTTPVARLQRLMVYNVTVLLYSRDPHTRHPSVGVFQRRPWMAYGGAQPEQWQSAMQVAWVPIQGVVEHLADRSLVDTANRLVKETVPSLGLFVTPTTPFIDLSAVVDFMGFPRRTAHRVFLLEVDPSKRQHLVLSFRSKVAAVPAPLPAVYPVRPLAPGVRAWRYTNFSWLSLTDFCTAILSEGLEHTVYDSLEANFKKLHTCLLLPGCSGDTAQQRYRLTLRPTAHRLAQPLVNDWHCLLQSTQDFPQRQEALFSRGEWQALFNELIQIADS